MRSIILIKRVRHNNCDSKDSIARQPTPREALASLVNISFLRKVLGHNNKGCQRNLFVKNSLEDPYDQECYTRDQECYTLDQESYTHA